MRWWCDAQRTWARTEATVSGANGSLLLSARGPSMRLRAHVDHAQQQALHRYRGCACGGSRGSIWEQHGFDQIGEQRG